ncbi:YwmB family TATA-box binding protein [Terribacillus saccharophilus]|uniref:YwmB family TATA-box binding protein n=1 Tax=Terribacillus saccharophilus TaxID=361277 RepID=UPI0037F2A0E5
MNKLTALIVCIFVFCNYASVYEAEYEAGLNMIVEKTTEPELLNPTSYSLIYKKNITLGNKKGVKSRVNKIRDETEDYQWTEELIENKYHRLVGTKTIKDKAIKLLLIYYKVNDSYQLEMAMEIKGQEIKSNDTLQLNEVDNKMKKEGYTPYYAIKGTVNKTMDRTKISEALQDAFGAKTIDTASDEGFYTVSAASPYLGKGIKVKGEDMNLNITIRNSADGKADVTVGYPIILIEH